MTFRLPVSLLLLALMATAAARMLLIEPSGVHAAFPGQNGKIAYVVNEADSQGRFRDVIYVVSPDGSGRTLLTNIDGYIDSDNPAWSPDGSKIAFDRNELGLGREIYVMYADGSAQLRLTYNLFVDESPSWSPDGSKLVFVSERDGNRELYVMNANGTGQTRLTTTPQDEMSPTWSPDGQKIVFGRSSDVYSIAASGGPSTLLAANGGSPSWSPDGTSIVFHSSAGPYASKLDIINADGTGRIAVLYGGGFYGFNPLDPAWAPNGSRIAFAAYPDTGYVKTMNLDGSDVQNVVNLPAVFAFQVDWQPLCDTCQPVGGIGTEPSGRNGDSGAGWLILLLSIAGAAAFTGIGLATRRAVRR